MGATEDKVNNWSRQDEKNVGKIEIVVRCATPDLPGQEHIKMM